MKVLPVNPAENSSPEALAEFLAQCREMARADKHAKLVSISIAVDALDPLAVLESIFEPEQAHFYTEHPQSGDALAGAEPVLTFTAKGKERFSAAKRFVEDTLEHSIAVGCINMPYGGPHFFTAFSFLDEVPEGAPFCSAQMMVPRWQVACQGSRSTAVANVLIEADSEIAPLVERIWRAHGKFTNFDYRKESEESLAEKPQLEEVGDYRASVAEGLRRIDKGEFEKIVLARAIDLKSSEPLHPLRLLNILRERFPDCYAFSLANGKGHSFIGASPERLLRVREAVLETEALAGSIRRGGGASEDAALGAALLHSEKNLREQRHVLDSIRRHLAPLRLEMEFPSVPILRKLANVQHLLTPVCARLPENLDILDVLAALHPTPAVGGSPREKAVPAIRELEKFDRGLYAGAVGWLNHRNEGEFFVAIRSALVQGAHARLYAGAGIVKGSEPDEEFAETELKFRALLQAFFQA